MGAERYRVLQALFDGRRRYGPGDEIELDLEPDDPLLADGTIEALDADTDPGAGGDPDTDPDTDTEMPAPAGGQEKEARGAESREARLLAAIGDLEADNADHWTKKGKPEIRALEALAGLHDVSAKERDAVWDAYRTARKADDSANDDAAADAEGDDGKTGDSEDAGAEGETETS